MARSLKKGHSDYYLMSYEYCSQKVFHTDMLKNICKTPDYTATLLSLKASLREVFLSVDSFL